jgi:G:T-mismatch repair DNA endonuclease (very short patch repair protein)
MIMHELANIKLTKIGFPDVMMWEVEVKAKARNNFDFGSYKLSSDHVLSAKKKVKLYTVVLRVHCCFFLHFRCRTAG